MKRIIPLLIVAVAASLFWFRERWLPAAANHTAWLGSVEGDITLLGAAAPGRIVMVSAVKGKTVAEDALLFQLDDTAARGEVRRLEAVVVTAKATLLNLESGKRGEEMDLIARQEKEAEANLALARVDFERARDLSQRGITATSAYDKAKAALAVAEERLQQVKSSATIARLPAREAELAAARSRIMEAEAALATAEARLADYQAKAPATALVDDVFFSAGEVVAAGQPIVALLQPGKTTLRFFIPETARSAVKAGVQIRYSCDGCSGGSATISHVAAVPEYTPPVIYSASARSKLVFLAEAVPTQDDPQLQPGLPIEVEPLP